jgi:peptide/nickel transport system permease protein
MIHRVLRRLLLAIPIVIGSSLITFSILYFVPGDPVVTMLGDRSRDTALVEKLRAELRLNDPFLVRYGRFVGGVTRLDFGRSYRTGRPISADLAEAIPATMELAVAGLTLAILLGVVSGAVSALRRGSALDYAAMAIAIFGVSVPVFWLALMLQYLLAFRFSVFGMEGRLSADASVGGVSGFLLFPALFRGDWSMLSDALGHIALPAITLGLIGSALVARMTRSSVLEVLTQDYVRTARAKGLSRGRVLWHVGRNALLPVVTVIGLQFGALLGGAIITEEIFAWPGVGTYLLQAIRYRDIVAVQGTVMMIVLVFLLVNLTVDMLYTAIDPRLRTEA